ncbi:MAG TPA: hypothetical protein VFJ91_03275 [Gaiellaceae bacterium]|nr:hypothetical protein [Gaiellaceae bacterium]
MGWHDRDWARLDDERDAIYGSRHSVALRPAVGLALAASLVATGGFGYLHLGWRIPTGTTNPPAVVYGTPVYATDGTRACTAFRLTTAGRWLCAVLDFNPQHLSVAEPPPYRGTCGYLAADQNEGAWTCTSTVLTPDDHVPDTQLLNASAG